MPHLPAFINGRRGGRTGTRPHVPQSDMHLRMDGIGGGSNAGGCPVCRRDLDSVDGSPQGIIAGAYAFTSEQLERVEEEDGDDEQEHEQLGDDVQNPDQEEEPAQSSSGPSSEGNTSRSELDADADAGGSNDDGSGGGGDGGAHHPNSLSAMAEGAEHAELDVDLVERAVFELLQASCRSRY